jgi:hypothetical protein
MSLQALWSLFLAHPAAVLNALALFFALAGSWLLLATRLREQRAVGQLAADNELDEIEEEASLLDAPTQRLNQFFYRFGYSCLGLAMIVSWGSTHL